MHFLALAPEVDKMVSRRLDLSTFQLCLQSRQNNIQEVRFKDFLVWASEIDKISPRKSDLNIFCHWLRKSIEWVPRCPIEAFSGLGFRSRQNMSQEIDFRISWPLLQKAAKQVPGDPILEFLTLDPEVDKMIPGIPISAFSGLGSRSQQNQSQVLQEFRFKHILALAPEFNKIKSGGPI